MLITILGILSGKVTKRSEDQTGPNKDRFRSKRSQKYIKYLPPIQPLTKPEEKRAVGKGKAVTPPAFVALLSEVLEALDLVLGKGSDGAKTRTAAVHESATLVLQVGYLPSLFA